MTARREACRYRQPQLARSEGGTGTLGVADTATSSQKSGAAETDGRGTKDDNQSSARPENRTEVETATRGRAVAQVERKSCQTALAKVRGIDLGRTRVQVTRKHRRTLLKRRGRKQTEMGLGSLGRCRGRHVERWPDNSPREEDVARGDENAAIKPTDGGTISNREPPAIEVDIAPVPIDTLYASTLVLQTGESLCIVLVVYVRRTWESECDRRLEV